MKTLKSRDFHGAFAVDQTALQRLVQALGGDAAVSQIHVGFRDGSVARPEHVSELPGLRGGNGKRIETLSIECARAAVAWEAGRAPPRYVLVTLRDGGGASIRYHVSGEERDVVEVADELDGWLASVRPWYYRLAGSDATGFLVISLLTATSLAMLALALRATVPTAPGFLSGLSGSARSAAAEGLSLASVLLPVLAGSAVTLLRRRLFPPAEFALGRGEGGHAKAEALRKGVGLLVAAAAVLGLAAGVVAGLLA